MPRAGQPVEVVPNRDGRRIQMRKLADDRTTRGIGHEEAHEPNAVVRAAIVGGNEQAAQIRRQTLDERVARDDVAALRDLDAFVEIHARVLAADDVFRRRVVQPEGESEQERRNDGLKPWPRRTAIPEPGPEGQRKDGSAGRVEGEQAIERIRAEHGKGEGRPRRPRDAEDDGPERAFVPVEALATIPIAKWKTERQSPWDPAKQQAGGHETDHSANPITTPESSPPPAGALTSLTIS